MEFDAKMILLLLIHHGWILAETSCDLLPATMTKIIKEMLPPDVRVARDAQDLLIECCVGEIFYETLGDLNVKFLCL